MSDLNYTKVIYAGSETRNTKTGKQLTAVTLIADSKVTRISMIGAQSYPMAIGEVVNVKVGDLVAYKLEFGKPDVFCREITITKG